SFYVSVCVRRIPNASACRSIRVDSHSLFFFNDTATTEIYTLSLHDALPICTRSSYGSTARTRRRAAKSSRMPARSEEHTSELQSLAYLVCRLLLEKKKT